MHELKFIRINNNKKKKNEISKRRPKPKENGWKKKEQTNNRFEATYVLCYYYVSLTNLRVDRNVCGRYKTHFQQNDTNIYIGHTGVPA